MLDHQLARPRTFVLAQENDRRAPAQASPADDMTGVHSRTLTQACYGLPLGSRWPESIRPCILPAPVAAGLPICAMSNAPLIGQQTLVDYARGCQSTTHRPLNCRCDCKRARTEHGSDAADMPGQEKRSPGDPKGVPAGFGGLSGVCQDSVFHVRVCQDSGRCVEPVRIRRPEMGAPRIRTLKVGVW